MKNAKALFAFVCPRPQGFIHKSFYFWFGVIIALPCVQQGDRSGFHPLDTLWFFLVQEVLLQQAKFLWNDLRDMDVDKHRPRNQGRFLASGVMPISFARWHIVIRWTLSLILGWGLSSTFAIILMVITVHQWLYELAVKPHSNRYPIIFLAFLSFNLPLRMLGGITSVSSTSLSLQTSTMLLPLLLSYFWSWMSLSNLYFVEAHKEANDFMQKYNYTITRRFLSFQSLSSRIRQTKNSTTDGQSGFRYLIATNPTVHGQTSAAFTRKSAEFFYVDGRRVKAIALLCSMLLLLSMLLSSLPAGQYFWGLGMIILFACLLAIMRFTIPDGFDGGIRHILYQYHVHITSTLGLFCIIAVVLVAATYDTQWVSDFVGTYTLVNYALYVGDHDG